MATVAHATIAISTIFYAWIFSFSIIHQITSFFESDIQVLYISLYLLPRIASRNSSLQLYWQAKKPLVKTMTTGLNLYFSLCSHLRSNITRYCSATLSSFYLLVIVKLLKCKLRDQFYFVFHLTQFKLCNINSLHNVRNFFKQKVNISCGVC